MSDKPHIAFDSGLLNKYRSELGANLPNGWELTTLGEAFKWGSGGTPKRTETKYYDGKIPWLIIGDLNDGIVSESQTNITEEGLKNSSAKWIEPGSVLLAMYGSIGKLGITGARLTTNQAIAFTKPEPFDSKYLFYYLMFVRDKLATLGKGATQKNISQTVIKAFPFVAAPQEQQKQIVAEIEKQFSRLDEAVTSLKRAKANLKRYKAAVEGKLTEEWRKQHPDVEPASELLKRILAERRRKWEEAELAKMLAKGKEPKDDKWKKKYKEPAPPQVDDFPNVPSDWSLVSIEQISVLVTDGDHNPPKRVPKGIPHLTAKNVRSWKLTERGCSYIHQNDFKKVSKRYMPKAGDVIITCVGTIGRTAIVPADCIFSVDRNLAAIRLVKDVMEPKILQINLNTVNAQKRISSASGSTAQPHFYLSELRSFPVALMPLSEQQELINMADSTPKCNTRSF
ncbi:MAG: restriction endonuclease subunit S [Thermoleophilia bacterium]